MATALPKISVLEDPYPQVDLSASVPPFLPRGSVTEAWRKVLRNDGPLLPEEWRLPHGPLPARPDYSRVSRGQSYPQDQRRIERDRKLRKAWRQSRLSDSYSGAHQVHSELYIDHGGVSGWVSQPLRFVPIVGFAPFKVRSVYGTDVRDHVHNPRGLCHGCVRLICDPSYLAAEHPERVGGGYLYGEERGKNWPLGGAWWRGRPSTHPEAPADWDTAVQMKHPDRAGRNASSLPRLPSYTSAGKSADDSRGLKTKGTRPTRDQGSGGSAVSLPKVGSPALSRARSCSVGKDPDAVDLESVNLPRIAGLNAGLTPPATLDAGDDSDLESDRMDLLSLTEDVADAETTLPEQISGKLQVIDEDIEGMANKMRPGSADSGLGSTLSGGTSSDDSSYANSRKRAEVVRKQGKHVRWKRNPVQVEFLVEPTLEETSPVPSSPQLSGSGSDRDMTSRSPSPDPEWTEQARSVELPPLPNLPDLESADEDAKKEQTDLNIKEKQDVTEGVRSAKTTIKRKPKPKPKTWRDLIKPAHSVPAARSRSAKGHVDDDLDDALPDGDPLDYLAKYCIVRPSRLPTYEAIFTWYAKGPEEDEEVIPGKTAFNQRKSKKLKSASSSSLKSDKDSGADEDKMGPKEMFNDTPQDYKEKVTSKIAYLQGKQDDLRMELHQLRGDLVRSIAAEARRPGALSGAKTKKGKSKGKKKSKKSKSKKSGASAAGSAVNKSAQLRKMDDKELIASLTKQEKENLESLIQVKRVRAEMTSREDRIKKLETRIRHLQDEIRRADWKLTKQRQADMRQYTQSPGFRRAQSSRYRTLHPEIDVELDVEDLKDALFQVNSHLSTKELDFISHVLDIPGRLRLNLKLFSAVAALSERITEVEPFVKKLIDKMDFEALSVKMERCKEMFRLLSDQYNDTPPGTVKTHALGVEMAAGGLRNEHIKRVLCKLDREGTGLVDFLTYLIYIPLFIEIHERIVDDPLASDRFR